MKATFDFIPGFCPSCGKQLFKPPAAEYLRTSAAILEDYQNGQPFTCDRCGLAFQKEQPQPEQKPQAIHPLGWLAGKPGSISDVIQMLSNELLGHAADLEEQAARGRGGDPRRAADLRRYGWALWLLRWQLLTPQEKAGAVIDRASLEGLSKEYKLTLPDDLAA